MDLNFEERGEQPLTAFKNEWEKIRSEYFSYLMPDIDSEEVKALLAQRRFLVLQGPPGTGKTRMALQILDDQYKENGFTVQFHPGMTYENFVGGLAPVSSEEGFGFKFAPQKGFLMQAAEAAQKSSKPFLLVIDEINRTDLAKVLGEAIFLFEDKSDQKRKVEMPYDFGEPFFKQFSLPDNLHVLGTMNSADRSIAIVDVAVRRRFAFLSLWPQMKVVEEHGCEITQKAFRDLVSIFVEYAVEDAFALMPGHSYFLEKDDNKAPKHLMVNLVPLLQEYLAQGYVASFSDSIRSYLQWIESIQQ
jgi:5-methylcytosine-specific restriction protein B